LTSSESDREYKLKFVPAALTEWQELDGSVKENFKILLKKRLKNPYMPGSRLGGALRNCYKIKLLKQGYRLIYEVLESEIVVLVLAVNRRADSVAYDLASKRRE
jgi:mRNA interferase RelE/StbE